MSNEKQDTERITISFPEDEEYLLDKVDELVESTEYENRTDAIRDAIDALTGHTEEENRELMLYDAAVSSLYAAEKESKDEMAENARKHITENFPKSGIARYLEQE